MYTTEQIKSIIGTSKTKSTIESKLKKANVKFNYDSEENEFRINNPDGSVIRIYKSVYKEIKVLHMQPFKMQYSGTPVFFGSL